MDDVTDRVARMYARFPYPSPSAGAGLQQFHELANLFHFLTYETGCDLDGRTVLDAGTGTGHRLVQAARSLGSTQFTAVDMVAESLDVARQVAVRAGVTNIRFEQADLMDGLAGLGPFDVILCMGVLHHLAEPTQGLRNLKAVLEEDGFALLYLYGRPGAQERMRRKGLLSLLMGERQDDLDLGIRLARQLGFEAMEFGWNLEVDAATTDSLIVDAYLNVNERLYDSDSIHELAAAAGFPSYAVFGITTGTRGLLFDARPDPPSSGLAQTTPSKLLGSDLAVERYRALSVLDRCRVADLLYKPNGYTVLAMTEGARKKLGASERVRANTVETAAEGSGAG